MIMDHGSFFNHGLFSFVYLGGSGILCPSSHQMNSSLSTQNYIQR